MLLPHQQGRYRMPPQCLRSARHANPSAAHQSNLTGTAEVWPQQCLCKHLAGRQLARTGRIGLAATHVASRDRLARDAGFRCPIQRPCCSFPRDFCPCLHNRSGNLGKRRQRLGVQPGVSHQHRAGLLVFGGPVGPQQAVDLRDGDVIGHDLFLRSFIEQLGQFGALCAVVEGDALLGQLGLDVIDAKAMGRFAASASCLRLAISIFRLELDIDDLKALAAQFGLALARHRVFFVCNLLLGHFILQRTGRAGARPYRLLGCVTDGDHASARLHAVDEHVPVGTGCQLGVGRGLAAVGDVPCVALEAQTEAVVGLERGFDALLAVAGLDAGDHVAAVVDDRGGVGQAEDLLLVRRASFVQRRGIGDDHRATQNVDDIDRLAVEQLRGVGQVLADQLVEDLAGHHLCHEQAGGVAELGVSAVDRAVGHASSGGHVVGGAGHVADRGNQGGDGSVQLVGHDGFGQVAGDDLQRLGRVLLNPRQLGRLPEDRAEAASDLDAVGLNLRERGGGLGVVGGVAVDATLSRVQTSPQGFLQEVAIDALRGQADRAIRRGVELLDHLGDGFDGGVLQVLVEHLHVGQCHWLFPLTRSGFGR
uniref:Uncharacterized protein n=1 Tax=Pakpunavirus sp. TaxID=2833053 RepID=A0AB39C0K5_9CAUD